MLWCQGEEGFELLAPDREPSVPDGVAEAEAEGMPAWMREVLAGRTLQRPDRRQRL